MFKILKEEASSAGVRRIKGGNWCTVIAEE